MTDSGKRTVCVGEATVELARGADGRFALGSSGDTFNTAIYLARAGQPVAFASALGDDPYSDAIFSSPLVSAWPPPPRSAPMGNGGPFTLPADCYFPCPSPRVVALEWPLSAFEWPPPGLETELPPSTGPLGTWLPAVSTTWLLPLAVVIVTAPAAPEWD